MIYFLYGDNTEESGKAVHAKASALAAELLKKKPDASFFTLTDENWNEAAIEEYTGGQGLFEHKHIVMVKDVFSAKGGGKERRDAFLKKIELFAASPNIFIFAENFLDKAPLKKIQTHAAKVQEIRSTVSSHGTASTPFNVFGIADAFGARDKKKLWILYRTAIALGKAPEEIHGLLFWQVKSMILSKRYGGNFTRTELAAMMKKLVSVYHDAHRGMHDFETALEIFVLNL